MGELVKIQREENRPRVICPHCKDVIYIHIEPFKKDVTKILRDKCPKCHGEIFTGLLILCHPEMKGIIECLKIVINAIKTQNKIIG